MGNLHRLIEPYFNPVLYVNNIYLSVEIRGVYYEASSDIARLSLSELARQNLKPQSKIMITWLSTFFLLQALYVSS